jgi:DNA-binding MarR family transcriptional regulator
MFESTYPISSDHLTTVVIWNRELNRRLEGSLGLSFSQMRVLDYLARNGGHLHPSELALLLEVAPNTVSHTLNRMEQAKLVRRDESEKDRRTLTVTPTGKGSDVLERARAIREELRTSMLAPLGGFLKELTQVSAVRAIDAYAPKYPFQLDASLEYAATLTATRLGEQLRPLSLGMTSFRVLFLLGEHPEGLAAHRIAKELLMHLSELSRECDRLLSRGLILRRRDTVDKRMRIFELSSDGYWLLGAATRLVDAQLMKSVPAHIAEKRAFLLKSCHIIVSEQRRHFRYE